MPAPLAAGRVGHDQGGDDIAQRHGDKGRDEAEQHQREAHNGRVDVEIVCHSAANPEDLAVGCAAVKSFLNGHGSYFMVYSKTLLTAGIIVASSSMSCWRVLPSEVTSRMVSSPAMVPATLGKWWLSMSEARPAA